MLAEPSQQLLRLYADILDYPNSTTAAAAREGARRVAAVSPQAAQAMQAFVAFAEDGSVSRLQEIYTRTFDIAPATNLYVGYHLFGESFKRGAFLARLEQAYRAWGFSSGTELADHLCTVLRFAGSVDDPEFLIPLLAEGVLPSLKGMTKGWRDSANGYRMVLESLERFLTEDCRALAAEGVEHD